MIATLERCDIVGRSVPTDTEAERYKKKKIVTNYVYKIVYILSLHIVIMHHLIDLKRD